jgi:hypothetical protein
MTKQAKQTQSAHVGEAKLMRKLSYSTAHGNFMDRHPKAKEIMSALMQGVSQREIVSRYSTSDHPFTQSALSKWYRNHLQPSIELAAKTTDPDTASKVIHDNLKWIFKEAKVGAKKALSRKRVIQDSAGMLALTDIEDPDFLAHQTYLTQVLNTAESLADIAGENVTTNRQIGAQLTSAQGGMGGGPTIPSVNLNMAIAMPRSPTAPMVEGGEVDERDKVFGEIEMVEEDEPTTCSDEHPPSPLLPGHQTSAPPPEPEQVRQTSHVEDTPDYPTPSSTPLPDTSTPPIPSTDSHPLPYFPESNKPA